MKLPDQLGGAAGTLLMSASVVNSLFALILILVLTAFLLANGRGWVDQAIASRPRETARAPSARARQHGGGGRGLRRRCADDRADRRCRDLHRAHDPRGAVRRARWR